MSKKTPWFSGTVKPVRPGVYERRYVKDWRGGMSSLYAFWTGRIWRPGQSDLNAAPTARGESIFFAGECKWRGLAEDPSK